MFEICIQVESVQNCMHPDVLSIGKILSVVILWAADFSLYIQMFSG